MAQWSAPLLSQSASSKLSQLGIRFQRKQSDRALREILAELDGLPPAVIARAAQEIAEPVSYRSWLGRSVLEESVGRWSERHLMARNVDYAWVFLFHTNGHVREAALDRICASPASPFFLAALALRLNDWAEPVRRAAARCIERIATEIPAAIVAEAALYLLNRRFVWSRWHNEAKALDLIFARDDALAELVGRLQSLSSGPMAACLRDVLQYPGIDRHLPKLAARAVQPSVRAIAYQCLISGNARWQTGYEWMWIDKVYNLRKRVAAFKTRELEREQPVAHDIANGLRDKSALVRRIVADAMIVVRSQIQDERELIAVIANDPSPAVRSRADFMMRRRSSLADSSIDQT
jgi:hypothetical protein